MMFIDINYDMTENTLQSDGEMPCSYSVDRRLDDCLEMRIPAALMEAYNCTVPYLPGPEPVCRGEAEMEAAVEKYDFLSKNGQLDLCDRPCSTIEVYTGTQGPVCCAPCQAMVN